MIFHWRKFHIGAISLIEIMMIFFIIGIVSVAGMSLSKPKADYIKRIGVYTAFVNLQNAVLNMASEGHIDFSTEIGSICADQNIEAYGRDGSTHVCNFYQNKYPGIGTQLPKVIARKTLGTDAEVDPGLSTTAYANLTTAIEKEKYKYMQSGFCQRLASIYKLEDYNIGCATNITKNTLIDDSASIPINFSGFTPQLYLPNGHVVYLGKYLYNNYFNTRQVVTVDPLDPSYNGVINNEENYWYEYWPTALTTTFTSIDTLKNSSLKQYPNEFRDYVAKYAIKHNTANNNISKLARDYWANNKDYFNVYIDINGKMASSNDTANGPDRLNQDVFLFHVYRDGAVRPAYETGFPLSFLTAKVMTRTQNSNRYEIPNHSPIFAMRPLVYASCYANTAGAYSAYANGTDYTGMCGSIAPLTQCIDQNGTNNCRIFINKPSFVIKKIN